MYARKAASLPRFAAITALMLTYSFGGCKTAAPPPDDNSLNTAVQARLASDAAISAEPVQTFVQAGVATLQGTVSSQAARALAASDASQVAGIRSVVNNLTVETPAQPAPVPAATVVAPTPAPAPTVKSTPKVVVKPAPQRYVPPPHVAVNAPIERPAPQQQAPPVQQRPVPPPPPAFRNVTIPAGTPIPVRITQTLDSATTQQGDTFSGTISSDVVVDGLVAIPAGSSVNGRVDEVHEAAHFKGSSLLTISLVTFSHRGERTTISTDPYSKEGNGRGKNTAAKVGGGAAVGAVLGGIFGGGKGAAIGAAAGGGVGAGAQGLTRGQQVQIPSESLISFRLTSPVDVRVSTAQQSTGDSDLQRHPSN